MLVAKRDPRPVDHHLQAVPEPFAMIHNHHCACPVTRYIFIFLGTFMSREAWLAFVRVMTG